MWEAIMIWTMHMDSLEWQKVECGDVESLHTMPFIQNPTEKQYIPVDLAAADIDAFLRRMYALQQC